MASLRSQVGTVMAPNDERCFLEFAFEDPDVFLITDARFPTKDIPHARSTTQITSIICSLWNKSLLPHPQVDYIKSCNDYYLHSEESLVQFLRSPINKMT